jgi:hypothetical protein
MIKIGNRKAAFCELKYYCHLAGDHDYMEITKWTNGEGYDICIDRKHGSERFSMTEGEIQLLQVLVNFRD